MSGLRSQTRDIAKSNPDIFMLSMPDAGVPQWLNCKRRIERKRRMHAITAMMAINHYRRHHMMLMAA
eukprot:12336456-Alexandrium_andersonii.AAC.1